MNFPTGHAKRVLTSARHWLSQSYNPRLSCEVCRRRLQEVGGTTFDMNLRGFVKESTGMRLTKPYFHGVSRGPCCGNLLLSCKYSLIFLEFPGRSSSGVPVSFRQEHLFTNTSSHDSHTSAGYGPECSKLKPGLLYASVSWERQTLAFRSLSRI